VDVFWQGFEAERFKERTHSFDERWRRRREESMKR
jgi:hypothetical protein